jgi:hypothetical protein
VLFGLLMLYTRRGSTIDIYRSYVKKAGLESDVVKLDNIGTSGGWIGSPKAKNVLLYFPG